MQKTQIATIILRNNVASGIVSLQGQDIINNRQVINIWQNTSTATSSGTSYTGEFELTIVNLENTRIYDRIPNNSIQKDADSNNYIQIQFDNISLDKSFVQFITPNDGNYLALLVEYVK